MLIRPLSATDAETVNSVALAAFAQYQGIYSDWHQVMQGVGSMASLANSAEILVADLDGTIVGAVAYLGPGVQPRADFFRDEWAIISS